MIFINMYVRMHPFFFTRVLGPRRLHALASWLLDLLWAPGWLPESSWSLRRCSGSGSPRRSSAGPWRFLGDCRLLAPALLCFSGWRCTGTDPRRGLSGSRRVSVRRWLPSLRSRRPPTCSPLWSPLLAFLFAAGSSLAPLLALRLFVVGCFLSFRGWSWPQGAADPSGPAAQMGGTSLCLVAGSAISAHSGRPWLPPRGGAPRGPLECWGRWFRWPAPGLDVGAPAADSAWKAACTAASNPGPRAF